MAIENHFTRRFLAKQQDEGRRITLQEVHRETGVAWSTLQRWEKGEVDRFDAAVLSALCAYFGCQVGELLQYVPDETGD